ncbi:hypothetical protein ThidrDRAFT_0144 [Thiorhodococcus drewsii AZ1]|uniref:Uncharacterized protein n=1 Tax=Thiorhodococcus drewsii AZ1 TaxID=765913 RepID=G2DVH4_9GAMM|nr:hypothetical protein [Thiorhodococcus drewsii]EGV33989.1 hypothetical protein ThidrDRAFT_0144 [Thiorhodococcus drewsii AZ1]
MLAFIGASVLLILGVWGFYRSGDPVVAPTLMLSGESLSLTNGEGAPTPNGVRVDALAPNGNAIVQAAIKPFDAALYRDLRWRVDGLGAGQELRLIWASKSDPRSIQARPLSGVVDGEGRIDLRTDPHWRGQIVALGLVVLGELHGPILVRGMDLRPRLLSFSALRDAFLADWTFFEGWTGRSPHFNRGAPLGTAFSPVVLVFLWVGLACVLYLAINPPWRFKPGILPYAAFFLIGWIVLDLHWQWDLSKRLDITKETYAGLSDAGKQAAGSDSSFYPYLMELRRRLPEQPARLVLVSADPFGYAAMRTRYHLAPHNVFAGLKGLPEQSQLNPGDYVLLMYPLPRIRYDATRHRLIEGNRALPVELIDGRSSLGALFRVGKED